MHEIDTQLLSADPVQRLHLTQERIDLHAEYLRLTTGTSDISELEKAFVRVARGYGDRHGISFSAWRQIGVDADVLNAAGIKPTNKVRPNGNGTAPVAEVEVPAEVVAKIGADEPVAEETPAKSKAAARKAPAAAKKATTTAKKTATRSVKKKTSVTEPEQPNLLS
jgi:hypothetical protein